MAEEKVIVFIEDEPHLQEELTAALIAEGYIVKNAYDGETGLALAKSENPALVLLDLILPKLDGFAVLEALKANEETASIPVVVLSNLESAENVEKAIRLGATSYLAKPNYEMSHITAKVKNLIGAAK